MQNDGREFGGGVLGRFGFVLRNGKVRSLRLRGVGVRCGVVFFVLNEIAGFVR